ncbi:N-acetyltransferase [Blautia producta]|uniref:N-acetyltransferase n=2 Tax=Blautia producta TaxID=33035 RepID=A0A7G5N3M6_9FIRM|nr:N-acetyltransferase [Blautia producta ATCC 27340 = DSM 2950]QIB58802.1 N-acetyltransferase [Blautia producta ATCC 27340 = DSM 2950]QMW81311.1 N-acetyltransferase [Blautia producta]QMW81469.1 N-acetyltransferase [Blautia producta]
MAGFVQVNLAEMISEIGEDRVKAILSDFSCPLNKDVEFYIRDKAIVFAKQGWAATHLVFASYKDTLVLVGYFTLVTKVIMIYKANMSKTLQKKISKFSQPDVSMKRYIMSAPLIAQLGKNFNKGYDKLITGDELLKLACDKVKSIQTDVGGKFVYLECEDKPQLIDFYTSNGFVNFGKRNLDKDETDVMSGGYLVQMLRYLKN